MIGRFLLGLILVLAIELPTRAEELRYQGKTLAEWALALKDDDPALRLRAPQAIAQFGTRAAAVLPALQEAVRDSDNLKSISLVSVLGKIGPATLPLLLESLDREDLDNGVRAALADLGPTALPVLLQALASEDVVQRRRAVHGLALLGFAARDALPKVRQALRDRDALVRVRAAAAVPALDGGTEPGRPVLLEALRDKDAEVRRLAARALDTQDEHAAGPLRAALKDDSAHVRVLAVRALWRLDHREAAALLPVLTEGLKDADDHARRDAAEALDIIGGEAKSVIPALVEAARDTGQPRHLRGQRMSLWTLGRMGPKAQAAVPTLLAALQDEDAETGSAARLALVAVAGKDPAVVNQLVELLRHKSPHVRRNAVVTLHQLNLDPGTEHAALREALLPALAESDPWVRLRVAELLLRLDPEQPAPVLPVLFATLREPDVFLSRSAAQALRRLAAEALPVLTQGLQDRDAARRRGAAYALAEIARGGPAPLRELTAALEDDLLEVRVLAAFALAWHKSAEGVPALAAALKDPELELRQRGAEGLTVLGPLGVRAVPALVDALADPQDEHLRAVAARALGRIGAKKSQEVVPALTRALGDPRPQVRSSAVEALGAIGPQEPKAAASARENEPIPALIELLGDPIADVNAKTLDTLQRFGEAALPDLLNALKDANAERRRAAVNALARMGGNRLSEVLPALTALFQDPEPRVALTAAEAFLALNRKSADAFPRVLPLVRMTLKDPNAAVRVQTLKLSATSNLAPGQPLAEWAALCREALKDPEAVVRRQAVLGMKSDVYREKDNLAALLAALRDPEKSVRQIAAWGLSWYGPEAREAVPVLLEMLRARPEEGTRATAAFALGRIGREDRDVAAALMEALPDKEHASSRSIVIAALGTLGEVAKPAASLLIEALRDRDARVREAAMEALSGMGLDVSVVVPPLLEMLGNQDDTEDAVNMDGRLPEVIKKLGQPGLTEVNNGLSDRDAVRRLGAVIILGKLGPATAKARPGLEQALKDEDARVRVRAAEALWLVERKVERVLPVVVAGVKDRDVRVRRRAIRVVNLIGPQAKEAVPGLIEALKEKDYRLRLQAVQALGRIGPDACPAVPGLLEAVKDTKPGGLRLAALSSLGEVGPKAGGAVPPLLALVKDFDVLVRMGAVRALGRIGPQSKEVSAAVVEALRDPEATVRAAAVEAAGRAGPGLSSELANLLKDDNPDIRYQVAALLTGYGPGAKEALAALQQAVEDEDRRVAVQAAEALWQIDRRKTGLVALVRGLVAKDVEVRRHAVRVLGAMGPEAKDAVPALLSATQDADNLVRGEALQALQRIDPEAAAKAGKR